MPHIYEQIILQCSKNYPRPDLPAALAHADSRQRIDQQTTGMLKMASYIIFPRSYVKKKVKISNLHRREEACGEIPC